MKSQDKAKPKAASSPKAAPRGIALKIRTPAAAGKTTTVKFGSVVVTAPSPKKTEIQRNITSGQLALDRAAPKIFRAGVSLRSAKGVPLFHVDSKSGMLVRELNGRTETGKIIDGKFVVRKKA